MVMPAILERAYAALIRARMVYAAFSESPDTAFDSLGFVLLNFSHSFFIFLNNMGRVREEHNVFQK